MLWVWRTNPNFKRKKKKVVVFSLANSDKVLIFISMDESNRMGHVSFSCVSAPAPTHSALLEPTDCTGGNKVDAASGCIGHMTRSYDKTKRGHI